jgi:hypothetical protein
VVWCWSGGSGGGAAIRLEAGERKGFGPKTRNRAAVARFWAEMGPQEVEMGAVGLQPPPPVLT